MCFVDGYERFCLYEKSRNSADNEVAREIAIVQSSWIMTQVPRLVEYKNTLDRLQAMLSVVICRVTKGLKIHKSGTHADQFRLNSCREQRSRPRWRGL